jgi:UDP-N-acetylmuramate dehydrogenase
MICLYNESMKSHTTFRTGGNARRFCKVSSAEDIIDIIRQCESEKEPYEIIGNGSNLLVSDAGVDATVIQIFDGMNQIRVEGEELYAEAGAMLSKIAAIAKDNSLTGFEFAAGIPGTLGGAIVMNAGAYGGEMKDVVVSVDVVRNGHTETISGSEMQFAYRHSRVQEESMIVTGARLHLQHGDIGAITARMKELQEARISKQPLEYPSAGSTFKRPEGYFAGKLIMDAGLAGYQVGGAMVSPKHCGFVINYDQASASDIYQLMQDVIEQVYNKYQVKLEPEVRLIGDFN